MKQIRAYLVASICISAGCSFTPEVPTSMTATAGDEWPRLLSASEIARLEADVEGRSDVLDEETSELSKRVAALKEKAAAMNQPVLSEQERARLLQAASNGI